MPNPHKLPFIGKFAKSMATLRREDERGVLYHMNYTADYYKLLPAMNIAAKAGCSTFVSQTVEGDPFMARNYDLRHYKNNDDSTEDNLTGLGVVIHAANPRAKYKSVGVADAYWMDSKNGAFSEGGFENGTTDISIALLLPFLCMDGMNEKGLAVSIMYLPTENRWEETEYVAYDSLIPAQKRTAVLLEEPGRIPSPMEPRTVSGSYAVNTADKKAWKAFKNLSVEQKETGKKTVLHPVLMRMMLDSCKTTEEAIALAKTVNIKSAVKDGDYHILVTDVTGKSVMLEWIAQQLTWCETNHGANFYACREDNFGYGYDRANVMTAAMAQYSRGMPERTAMRTLSVVSQDCRDGSGLSFTQWSAVYNLRQKTLKLCVHMDYDHCYEYAL